MTSFESQPRTDLPPGPPRGPPLQRVNSMRPPPDGRVIHPTAGRSGDIKDIEVKWARSQKDRDFSKNFDHRVRTLHDDLVLAVKNADSQRDAKRKEEVLRQISCFVCADDDKKRSDDKDGAYTIDDCVRWVILDVAVRRLDNAEQDATIMDMILAERAYLAFENMNQVSIKNSCRERESKMHALCQDLKGEKMIPFHKAAKLGNARAIEIFLSRGKEFCNKVRGGLKREGSPFSHQQAADPHFDLLLHVAKQLDSEWEMTALELATRLKDEDARDKTIEKILEKLPSLAAEENRAFEKALNEGTFRIVNQFLVHKEAQKLFAKSVYIIKAMDKVTEDDKNDPDSSRVKIVQQLIKLAETREKFNIDVLGTLIKLNLMETWKEIAPKTPTDVRDCLLHIAVQHQNLDFVTTFLAEYPHLVTKKASLSDNAGLNQSNKQFYPLWYNNRRWEEPRWVSFSGCTEIRSRIIHQTIKQERKMQKLSEIFQQSKEPARELCFDLSHFNSKAYPVSVFVKSLIHHREGVELLKYEEVIRYAEFPPLDLNADDRETLQDNVCLAVEHTEVFRTLDWLWGKGVRAIISLKVPDRLINPHNEKEIAEYVKKFQVEILDWRFLDMSISVFEEGEVRDRITELHLYASGKQAPISHWLSSEGVKSLRNLKKLCIYVIKELGSEESLPLTVKYIRGKFTNLLDPKAVKVEVNPQFWNRTQKPANLNEIARRVAPKLSLFIESYRHLAYKRHNQGPGGFKAIKVAIIDNGILSIAPKPQDNLPGDSSDRANSSNVTDGNGSDSVDFLVSKSLSSRIKKGCSFVDDNFKLSPWFFASNPHGTQMANLICAMDPLCELYVAKVADGVHGMTPMRVARAIEWAISNKVDVISMSFTMLDTNKDLEEQLVNATTNGIVMLCSSHDEGSKVFKAWPADYPTDGKLTIAACDEYGKLIRDMDKEKYGFKVQGVNMAAGVIPFLDSNDRISGSSVATALAAGLSSLILSCNRLADPTKRRHSKGIDVVKKHFGVMASDSDKKFAMLDRFARIDEKIREAEEVDAEKILMERFGMIDEEGF